MELTECNLWPTKISLEHAILQASSIQATLSTYMINADFFAI